MPWLCCTKPDVACEIEDRSLHPRLKMQHASSKQQEVEGLGFSPQDSANSSPLISCAVTRAPTVDKPLFFDCLEEQPPAPKSVCSEEEWFPARESSFTASCSRPAGESGGVVTVHASQESWDPADTPEGSAEPSDQSSEEEWQRPDDGDDSGADAAAAAADLSSSCASSAASPQLVPSQLEAIATAYTQGTMDSCHALAKLCAYMSARDVSLEQLRAELAPLLAGDDGGGTYPGPGPVPGAAAGEGSGAPPPGGLAHLLDNLASLRFLSDICAREEGFKQVSFGGLQLYYDHDREAKKHYMKARCVLNEPLVNIVCLAREVDLVPQWNPALSAMQELGALSPNELLVYMALWVPWPMATPDVILRSVGADLLDQEGAVLIACRGVHSLPESCREPVLPSHHRQQLAVETGGFRFAPLPPDPVTGGPRTHVTVLIGLDGGAVAVPDAIISFVLKVFAPLVYHTVLRVVKRLFHPGGGGGSTHTVKLQERSRLYGPVAAHVDAVLRHTTGGGGAETTAPAGSSSEAGPATAAEP